MQDPHVKQPLQLFRIPCICGGLHSTGSCTTKTITKPTAPTTPTTTSATKRKSRQHGAASEKRRWSEFRRQARRRKFTVDITERHYLTLIKQPCGYCGSRQEGGRRIGVDRVCNAEHYTTENTISCCAVCNFMKRDMGLRAFVCAARAVSRGPMASQLPTKNWAHRDRRVVRSALALRFVARKVGNKKALNNNIPDFWTLFSIRNPAVNPTAETLAAAVLGTLPSSSTAGTGTPPPSRARGGCSPGSEHLHLHF